MFRIRIKKQENPKGILLKSNTVEITHTVKGADGADGQSAYDLWLAQGNTGSEADFLASLKGADGKNGADGKDGAEPIVLCADVLGNLPRFVPEYL